MHFGVKYRHGDKKLREMQRELSHETQGYRIYRTNQSGQDYQEIAAVVAGDSYLVREVPTGEGACFSVRAQEWSGLISRYSNEVSADGGPVARYVEAEQCEFTGFQQGFDPQGAGDGYYLFVPKEGVACALSLEVGTGGEVWARRPQPMASPFPSN